MSRMVKFCVTADAVLEEHWRVEVPLDVEEDALETFLYEKLGEGECEHVQDVPVCEDNRRDLLILSDEEDTVAT